MADLYDISRLQNLAKKKFEKASAACWNNPLFSTATKRLWENSVSSDSVLRDVIANIADDKIRALRDCGEFRDLMIARGDLCIDILNLASERNTASALEDVAISFEEYSEIWGRSSSAKKAKKKGGFQFH